MWLELNKDLLKTHLAEDEIEALKTVQLNVDVDDILQEECDLWSDLWRGKIAKKYPVDPRKNFVPSELLVFILAQCRYSSFTRLPNMGCLLDELRMKEWDRANQIFDNPSNWPDIEPPENIEPEPDWKEVPPVVYVPGYVKRYERGNTWSSIENIE